MDLIGTISDNDLNINGILSDESLIINAQISENTINAVISDNDLNITGEISSPVEIIAQLSYGGNRGDQGEKGDKGDKGDKGNQGDKGEKGDTGPTATVNLVQPDENGNIDLRWENIGLDNQNILTDNEYAALHSHTNKTALDNVSNINTGDETASGIRTKLGITTLSGSNTGDETTTRIGTLINGATAKTIPVDADMFALMDSAGSNVIKKLSWANIKTALDSLYASATNTLTFTNKRITKRVFSTTSATSVTPEISTYDTWNYTALAADFTINNHSTSTPTDGEVMTFKFLDNGTARQLYYGTNYVAKAGVPLPLTTVLGKNLTIAFQWNTNLSKWNLMAVGLED
jgi:hypothetical protein